MIILSLFFSFNKNVGIFSIIERAFGSLVLKVFSITVARDEHNVEVLSVEFSRSSAKDSNAGTNLKIIVNSEQAHDA